jgi:hypothetical protein
VQAFCKKNVKNLQKRFYPYICCMEKQITAIDQLIIELTRLGFNFKLYSKEIKKAKDKEKENIICSYDYMRCIGDFENGIEYFKNKYK